MLRSRNRKSISEVTSNVTNYKVHNQRSATPLTPPTKLSKSACSKLTDTPPVKIPLISKPNKVDRTRMTPLSDLKTKFHKETIASDKLERLQNMRKISDSMLIAKAENDDTLRVGSTRQKKYKKKNDEKKLSDSKDSIPHQTEARQNRKREMRNFNKGLQQSAQDLDGEIESYFEVLKTSISELVQEKVNQVFNACINMMMKRFNEMTDHMQHQEERMMKNINQINTKIVHYGEHHSRHFHYLCMKSEYDKLSMQSLNAPKKDYVQNKTSATQYNSAHSIDGHCPNCPCTPHMKSNSSSYDNSYSKNQNNRHSVNPPSEGTVLINTTTLSEKPIKLVRGGSDSAVNNKQNTTESIVQALGTQINNGTEVSIASLIGEFRKRKLAANNVGLKVPPTSPNGEASKIQNKQKIVLQRNNDVSTKSSELGLRDIMDTIKKYYIEPQEVGNNQDDSSDVGSKPVFNDIVDFNNTEEEYSDDYSTSHEDMNRN